MPRYLVILDVIYHGASYGTTRDVIEAETAAEAAKTAIREWKRVRPDRSYHALLVEPDGDSDDGS